jgi:hypothetical protein
MNPVVQKPIRVLRSEAKEPLFKGREAQKGDGEMPQELPWYMTLTISGNDGEDEGNDDSESEEEESESEDEEGGDDDKPDVEGLKSALAKERKSRREAERELRKQKRTQQEQQHSKDEEQTEVKKIQAERDTERSKSEKLAVRLSNVAVDNLIMRYAGDQFADLDDVLKLIDRADIDVDQDDEDPADITVDEETVQAAVKKLAKAKPHLLKLTSEGGKTGSAFGGGKKSDNGELTEEMLMARYPAIQK